MEFVIFRGIFDKELWHWMYIFNNRVSLWDSSWFQALKKGSINCSTGSLCILDVYRSVPSCEFEMLHAPMEELMEPFFSAWNHELPVDVVYHHSTICWNLNSQKYLWKYRWCVDVLYYDIFVCLLGFLILRSICIIQHV